MIGFVRVAGTKWKGVSVNLNALGFHPAGGKGKKVWWIGEAVGQGWVAQKKFGTDVPVLRLQSGCVRHRVGAHPIGQFREWMDCWRSICIGDMHGRMGVVQATDRRCEGRSQERPETLDEEGQVWAWCFHVFSSTGRRHASKARTSDLANWNLFMMESLAVPLSPLLLPGVTLSRRHWLCRCLCLPPFFLCYVVWRGFTTSCRRTFERNLRSLVNFQARRRSLRDSFHLTSRYFCHRCLLFSYRMSALVTGISNPMTALRRFLLLLVHRWWLDSWMFFSSSIHSTAEVFLIRNLFEAYDTIGKIGYPSEFWTALNLTDPHRKAYSSTIVKCKQGCMHEIWILGVSYVYPCSTTSWDFCQILLGKGLLFFREGCTQEIDLKFYQSPGRKRRRFWPFLIHVPIRAESTVIKPIHLHVLGIAGCSMLR